jgi:FkbM family methyltransferase
MKNTIRNLISRPALQPLFIKMLKLAHASLNYGGGQSVEESGELEALEFLRTATNSSAPFILFDVGANDGQYLGCALRILGKEVNAYSFEPNSTSFEILRGQFESDPRVNLRKSALSSESRTAELFFNAEGETTASLNRIVHAVQTHSETVKMTTIDELCAAERIDRIDLLKIDTEGHEMDVLLGARGMMAKARVAAIQFEFGDTFLHTPYHFVDFWELLSPSYTIYRILRRGLVKVERYTSDLEIYKIANFLCLDKEIPWNTHPA